MKIYKYVLILLVLFLIQFGVFPVVLPAIIQPNLVWMGLVLGLFLIPFSSLLIALFVVGMFVDALSSQHFGVNSISYILILGGIVSVLNFSFRVFHPVVFLGIVLISSFFVSLISSVLHLVSLDASLSFISSLVSILINNGFSAVFTTLASTIFIPLLRRHNSQLS